MPRFALRASSFVLLLPLLAGCRTYGRYDQTELHYAALQQAVSRFEQTLPRLEAEGQALRAAGGDTMLAHEFDGILAHARQVNTNGKARVAAFADDHSSFLPDEWVGASTYRRLNEAYGATATEQAHVADRYAALAALAGGRPDTTSYLAAAVGSSRYSIVPGQLYRIANENRTWSVSQAMRMPRPASSPQAPAAATPDSALVTPPSTTPPPADTTGTR